MMIVKIDNEVRQLIKAELEDKVHALTNDAITDIDVEDYIDETDIKSKIESRFELTIEDEINRMIDEILDDMEVEI